MPQSTMLLVGVKAATLSLDTARAAHGHEYAGQWSPQKTASFSALEVAVLLLTNMAPSERQWQDLIVTFRRILC